MVVLAAVVVLGGCGARNRGSASQSWSGVAAASSGDFVYVATMEGRVIQLAADTGVPVNARLVDPQTGGASAAPAFYGTPTLGGGHVYVGGYNGFIYSMDARNLGDDGIFEISGNPLAKGVAGSVIPDGDVVVVVAAEDANAGRLYVLEAESLVEVCRYPQPGLAPVGQIWSTPLVLDGVAYFGDLDHQVHAVSIDDCSPVWGAPTELGGAVVAPPVAVGGNLYVGSFDRTFYAIDRASGFASVLFSAGGWFWAGAATDGVRVYAPSLDGTLYAWNVRNKTLVWTYDQEGASEPILSTPVVVDDKVVMASDSGLISVLRTRDGGFEWNRKVGDSVRAPLTALGDVVFVHALDETVSAIDLTTKRLIWDRDLDDVP